MNNQTNINTSEPFPAFSEAVARHDIDPRRLAKFFGPFSESLSAVGISFPGHESANGSYFDSISAALASPELLPAPVRAALSTLETAATLENQNRLDDALNRRIPNVSLTPCPWIAPSNSGSWSPTNLYNFNHLPPLYPPTSPP